VLEPAEARSFNGFYRAPRVGFKHATIGELFARKPRVPWGGSADAVDVGPLQDRVGVDDGSGGVEPERTHATGDGKFRV